MATASSRNEPNTLKRCECNSTVQPQYESMLKLLLFQEAELQFKEEIISLLMEDEKIREILNKKLTKLNKAEIHDPVLALGRDNLYDEEIWDECFQDWTSPTPAFLHTVHSNSSFLGASTAMRTVEVAETQCKKYMNTFRSLEKMAYAYKKLKNKLKKERNDHAQEMSHASDITRQMEIECERLNRELQAEKSRTRELEKHVYLLTSTLMKERKKCVKVIRTLMYEIERLTEQLKLYAQKLYHTNNLVNGTTMGTVHGVVSCGSVEQLNGKVINGKVNGNLNINVNGKVNGHMNGRVNGIAPGIAQHVVVS